MRCCGGSLSLLTFAGVIVIIFSHQSSGDEESLSKRVMQGFPKAMAHAEKMLENVSGSGTYTRYKSINGQIVQQCALSFACLGDMTVIHRTWDEADPRRGKAIEHVECVNPRKYMFELLKYPDNDNFSVSNLTDNHRVSNTIDPDSTFEMFAGRFAGSSCRVFGVPVARMLKDPTFKITGISELDKAGKRLVKISYDFSPRDIILRSGWMMVSPEENWAIHMCESHLTSEFGGNVIVGTVEYGRENWQGIPIPVRSELRTPDGVHVVDFKKFTFDPALHESQFALSAFGVPEIGRSSRRGPASYILFFAAGLVALFIAAILKFLSIHLLLLYRTIDRLQSTCPQ